MTQLESLSNALSGKVVYAKSDFVETLRRICRRPNITNNLIGKMHALGIDEHLINELKHKLKVSEVLTQYISFFAVCLTN